MEPYRKPIDNSTSKRLFENTESMVHKANNSVKLSRGGIRL